jgi:hypothetical protein
MFPELTGNDGPAAIFFDMDIPELRRNFHGKLTMHWDFWKSSLMMNVNKALDYIFPA